MELYFRVLKLPTTDGGGDRDLFSTKVSHEAVPVVDNKHGDCIVLKLTLDDKYR